MAGAIIALFLMVLDVVYLYRQFTVNRPDAACNQCGRYSKKRDMIHRPAHGYSCNEKCAADYWQSFQI